MKGRKGRAEGGDATKGTKDWEEDLGKKNMEYTKDSEVNREAVERKHGGKAGGQESKKHAGRKPRKSGGRVGSNNKPLSSAHGGTPAKGRKTVDID